MSVLRNRGAAARRVWLAALLAASAACGATGGVERVHLDLFYAPGCAECERFKREVLPELDALCEGLYELAWHDMSLAESVPLLLAYQERCGNRNGGRISLVVDRSELLVGYPVLATGLCDRVAEALARRETPGWAAPPPPQLTAPQARALVETRGRDLTLPVVLVGGLTDGFNPCAIATLIFFLSVLAAAHASGRTRLLTGTAFIAASFLVYFGLGLGILTVFRRLPHWEAVRRVFEVAVGLCLVPLAALSFRDALRFRRTGRAEDVTLQIPGRVKRAIHAFTAARLGAAGPVLGGATAGAGVTLLESVCTGQGYAPVLAYLLKAGGPQPRTLALLALYNLLFVLPLAVVFVCFHRGLRVQALIAWSRRNLALAKLLLGLFFAAMAALLLARG